MTKRFQITEYDRVTINEAPFGVSRITDDAVGLTPEGGNGKTIMHSYSDLETLLQEGDADLQRDYYNPDVAVCNSEVPVENLADLDREMLELVLWRNGWVDTFAQYEEDDRVVRTAEILQQCIPAIQQEIETREELRQQQSRSAKRAGRRSYRRSPPSASTLLEWVRRKERSGGDPRSLIPRTHKSGNRRQRFCALVEEHIANGIKYYASYQRPSMRQTTAKVIGLIRATNKQRQEDGLSALVAPSKRSISRRIAKLDPYSTYAQRFGAAAANRKFGAFEEGVKASFPMERVEIDEWKVDVLTLLDEIGVLEGISDATRRTLETKRLWLYLGIDCATRCVVGMHLCENPNGKDAVKLLSLITRDKTDLAKAAGCESSWPHGGGLGIVAADLGPAFVDTRFQTAIFDLLGKLILPPGELPRLRARVERIFRTFGTQLMPLLAGRTFSNPIERGDYDSQQLAAHTRESLMRVLTIHVVDIYHNTPHRGLKGETPAHCWDRLSAKMGSLPYPSAIKRTAVFGITVERKVTGRGVMVFGVDYVCDYLRQAHKRISDAKVKIRTNPENLGWVMIWTGSEWVQARAIQSCFDGVSLGQWRLASRELGLKYEQQAKLKEGVVQRALEKVEQINAEQIAKFNVQIPFLTPDDLAREERQLHLGLTIQPEKQSELDLPVSKDSIGSEIPLMETEQDLFNRHLGPLESFTGWNADEEEIRSDKPTWGMEDDA